VNRIRFTPQADRDFVEIYQYIASDNIGAADRHHELLRSRCLALVDQPRIGTKRDEIKPGLRSIAEGDYVVFYRIPAATCPRKHADETLINTVVRFQRSVSSSAQAFTAVKQKKK